MKNIMQFLWNIESDLWTLMKEVSLIRNEFINLRFRRDLPLFILRKRVFSLQTSFSFIENEIHWILRNQKPVYLHCYYTSVKNTEENQRFYEIWVDLWLKQRDASLDFVLDQNHNLAVPTAIPLPAVTGYCPLVGNFPLSTEVKCLDLVVIEKPINIDIFDIFDNFDIEDAKQIQWILNLLQKHKESLCNINISRGYLSTTNIFTEDYPIINWLANKLINLNEWKSLDGYQAGKVYLWLLNIIYINIYKLCNKSIVLLMELKNDLPSRFYYEWLDYISRFKLFSEWAYNMLDNSIKQHLMKNAPSIELEVHSGFDTEFLGKDFGRNELLSAQIAKTGLIKIIVPKCKEFVYEGVNTRSGESYLKTPPMFDMNIQLALLEWINIQISEIRAEKYPMYDESLRLICNYLIESKEVINISENSNNFIFMLEKIDMQKLFIIPRSGEKLVLSFETLIHLSQKSIRDKLISRLEKLFQEIVRIPLNMNWQVQAEKITPSWDGNSSVIKNAITKEFVLTREENFLLKNHPIKKIAESHTCYVGRTAVKFRIKDSTYLFAHYNVADLTMLENWAEISELKIDILKKSYCSLLKPIDISGHNVYIRDTVLLASAVAATLDAVGKMHKLPKIVIDQKYLARMDLLKLEKPITFREYAMRDSIITLVHALFMIEFSFRLGNPRVPSTLGSLSTTYVANKWKADKYRGYQVNPNYPLGDVTTSLTPKGITSLEKVAEDLSYFVGSFRGGRNECFTYGVDKAERWFDYDLTSCYSTVMSILGDPDYGKIADTPAVDDINLENLDEELRKKAKKNAEDLTAEAHSRARDFAEELRKFKEAFAKDQTISMPDPLVNSLVQSEKNFSQEEEIQEEQELEQLERLTPVVSARLGDPDYQKQIHIHEATKLEDLDFLNSYSALRVTFNFPESIKFPPLPVNLNENITIYPLSGKTLITGVEYLSASNILAAELLTLSNEFTPLIDLQERFFIKITAGTYIPFKKDGAKPFYNVINDLQANRRKHPKKSALERIYKDLGNMLYGKIVSGIGNKRKYDARTRLMKSLLGSQELGSPIIGTYITGFVRSLLAELLYCTNILGGTITAVTTDGFVTNIENLEQKIIDSAIIDYEISFLKQYRDLRILLSGNPEALEIKTSVKGIMQWTTRGQLSLNHTDPALNNFQVPISAMTGFQSRQFSQQENIEMISSVLGKGNEILFLQKQLSGALDAYNKVSKQVSMFTSIRKFKTVFDTKRIITTPISASSEMLDSKPYNNVKEAFLHRTLVNAVRQKVYSEQYSTNLVYKSASAKDELLKYLIRAIFEFHEWDMDMDRRIYYIEVLKNTLNINPKISALLFAWVLQNQGRIVSKLTLNMASISLWEKLYIKWKDVKSLPKNLLEFLVNVKFSNFSIPCLALAIIPERPLALVVVNNNNWLEDHRSKLLKLYELLRVNNLYEIHPFTSAQVNLIMTKFMVVPPLPPVLPPVPPVLTPLNYTLVPETGFILLQGRNKVFNWLSTKKRR